jgi:Fe-S cluster biosynthesis and repair protein YggX
VSPTVACTRCGRTDASALDAPPFPGDLGREIAARACRDCWADWMRAEVMVINELRLNFMDPAAQDVLTRHLREFLLFEPPSQPES